MAGTTLKAVSQPITPNLASGPTISTYLQIFSFSAAGRFRACRYSPSTKRRWRWQPTVNSFIWRWRRNFTILPSARLQQARPAANLFISTELFLERAVYKFHVDWNTWALDVCWPDTPLAATSWPNAGVANAPQPGTATLLDVLQIRAMVQNQYTNFGGTESLWVPHTVRRGNTTGFAAPRWYQANVTGGNVAANLTQTATWDPDGANVIHRFMPSLALDRAGNMAMGYSTSARPIPINQVCRRLARIVNTFRPRQTFFAGRR